MTRQILDLCSANWRLGQAPEGTDPEHASWDELEQVDEWLPATVPGNIRADLVRAGRLPDLSLGTQAEASRWVDDHCWWLTREWSLEPSLGQRMHLVVRGVDYICDIFLNGRHLGRHEGMFSPLVRDVTELLEAENRIAVRIMGSRWLPSRRNSPWYRLMNHLESRVTSIGRRYPQRRDTLKCQMSFGWDFAPPLRTMGIWDDIYAVVTQEVFIQDVHVRQHFVDDRVQLSVRVEVEASVARTANLHCALIGDGFDAEPVVVQRPVELTPNQDPVDLELHVPRPRLWWPWDQGLPHLYRLTVDLTEGDRCLDSISQIVGLRQVEMDGWTLRINGRRVYARGANWVPADILPGRVQEEDYQALLSLAREAKMNMVRVWGGGLREKRAFYDLCDRMGIMVWQEFPLACAFLGRFPRSPEYLRLIERESEAIVRDLRAHPSLVLWCGGNEFSPERNKPVVNALRRSVNRRNPDRPFLAASPAEGDSHNWKVWHGYHPPSAYRHDDALFASEFGLQSVPCQESLEQFLPADELWPLGPSWVYHGAEPEKLRRYARPFLRSEEPRLDEFIQASQRAQAHALQIAVEHYRRAKARGGGGVLIWQLNEPWPAISWALIDFYRQPKAAYAVVRRLMNPVLISLEYPLRHYRAGDELAIGIWVVNDLHQQLPGCDLEVTLWAGNREALERHSQVLEIVADSANEVGRVDWTLPPDSGWRLTCELSQEGLTLAVNEYDLTVHDDISPMARQRLRSWLRGFVVPS